MAMYRIIDGGRIYTLDATLSGSLQLSGKTTDKPLQDGSEVSDHYVNEPNTATYSGVVSDVKDLTVSSSGGTRRTLTTEEALAGETGYNTEGNQSTERKSGVLDWITALRKLKESGRPFTLEVAGGEGTTLTQCVFTSISFDNDQAHGEFYEGFYSFNVTFSVKQIKRASRGKVVAQPDNLSTAEATSSLKQGSGSAAEVKEKDVDLVEQSLERARELARGAGTLTSASFQ